MRLNDVGRFAATALIQQPRRAGLSLLGVTIGVVAVVFLTTLGEGARRYVEDQFQSLGTDTLAVVPGKTETTGMMPGVTGVPHDLTLNDARALGRRISGAMRVAPVSLGNDTVSYGTRSRQLTVLGTTSEFITIREIPIARGSALPEGDMDRGAGVALLGTDVAKDLFAERNPIGEVIRVGAWRMRVIGVMGPRGTQLGQQLDDIVIIPVATAMRMFNRSSLFHILIQIRPFAEIEDVKREIVEVIIDRHDEEDITCVTPDSVVSSLTAILNTLTLVLVGIAAISLFVAGIGIMNVMLVTVSERRAEIGLLKATGATRYQVLFLFLTESLLISSAGGVLGVGLGLGLIQVLKWLYPVVPVATPIWAIFAVLGVALGTGAFFGAFPAWHAMRLDPVVALSSKG